MKGSMQLWVCGNTFNHCGGNSEGETPVLIPNTEVKPFSARGTCLEADREIESLPHPILKDTTIVVSFSFYANLRSNIYPIVKALLRKGRLFCKLNILFIQRRSIVLEKI